MGQRRCASALGAAAIVVALTGCGSSSQSSSKSSAGPAAASSGTASPTSVGGIAKPGAKLTIGQTATLPYQDPSSLSSGPAPYRLQVTVLSIKQGSLSDFKGVQLDATEKATTPYYVRFKLTNVGSGDLKSGPLGAVSGVDNTGHSATSVTFIGDFPPCDDTSPPKPFTKGKTWSNCQVFFVPGGIKKVAYSGFVQKYIESPVTWQ
jgi:hypothetical protein